MLALGVGSFRASAKESPWMSFAPEAKMNSLIDAQQITFSVSPSSQEIQFTQPKSLPLKFILVYSKDRYKMLFYTKTT